MRLRVVVLTLIAMSVAAQLPAQATDPAAELVGLWRAKKNFGPDARGPLLITRTTSGYAADMMAFTVPVKQAAGELWFDLPDGRGSFRGKVHPNGSMRGFWFAAPPGQLGPATPVVLSPNGTNRWQGDVVPQEETQTFFLLLNRQADGSLSALLRNIERDYGALLGVRAVVRTGNRVDLVGRRGAMTRDTVLVTGSYDSAQKVITLNFPYRGGSYDFRRDDDALSDFYPRGKHPERYSYRVPPALSDGWTVASVDDVGIDRAAIERAVQQNIDMSMDSINAPQVHALLVARKGKLVVEEYFHGEHRNKPHNLRSASKSFTATLAGAAMLAGAPLSLSSPVYQVMNDGVFPRDLEPRKRALTLEHLMTMTSGWFCDDSNEAAPGREDNLWDNDDTPDFAAFALTLPMASAPGAEAVYCSIQPHVALGMIGKAAGESPFYLFDRLVAAPLGITRYVWALDRARNPYGGGGMGLIARDFIKLGQLMLDSGVWQGKRIVSKEFVARATTDLYRIGPNKREYGLLWWPEPKKYNDRAIRAFAALGAGGQIVMVFPELELVVATNGGSYSSRGWRYIGGELITQHVLPAVRALK